MKLQESTLGELITIKHGYAFKSIFFAEAGKYILLSPGNCYEKGGLKLKGDREKYYVGEVPQDFILCKDDILVVMTDLVQSAPILGGAFFIPEDDKFLHNQRLGLIDIKNRDVLDKKYLFYVLNTNNYRSQVRGSATGTTVKHTAPERIYRCTIPIPNIQIQQKIADILSKYDDLIENNRRRIELLEESARLLYREWFVYLRFPGHEHTPIIDGIPEGWEKTILEKVGFLNYGKALKKDERILGKYPVFGSGGIIGRHNRFLIEAPGIIVARKGSIGNVFWTEENYYPIDTTYYINKEQSNLYLYYALQNIGFINTDVAVPGLNRDFAHSRNLLMPDKKLLILFDDFVNPVYKQISQLNQYNQKLTEARDILLPRLMNGEIAV